MTNERMPGRKEETWGQGDGEMERRKNQKENKLARMVLLLEEKVPKADEVKNETEKKSNGDKEMERWRDEETKGK